MKKRFVATLSGALLVLGLAACGGEGAGGATDTASQQPKDLTIGVSMPTQTSERWIADGNAVKEKLEAKGYKVDLQYAGDDIPTQSQQVDQMITQGADVLIIAAIDGTALSSQLQAAADKKIPVIAYDRLIRDSQNVDFYVSFDNYKVGVAQAKRAAASASACRTRTARRAAKPGRSTSSCSPARSTTTTRTSSSTARWTPSSRTSTAARWSSSRSRPTLEQVATLRWQQETAQKRMENLLTSSYNDGGKVDGVLSPYDGISRGIITALAERRLRHGGQPDAGRHRPGRGDRVGQADQRRRAELHRSSRTPGCWPSRPSTPPRRSCRRRQPEANDTKSYDNGVKVVPSYLLPIETVYKDDIQKALIDSGTTRPTRSRPVRPK